MQEKKFIWKTLGVMELSFFLHLKKNLFEKSTDIQLRKENLRVVFEFILSALSYANYYVDNFSQISWSNIPWPEI